MKLYLYVAVDTVAENRIIDWFTAENDGSAQRLGAMVYGRQRPIKDVAYYQVAELDSDHFDIVKPLQFHKVAEDAYKFPETVAVPVADYENLMKVKQAFDAKTADVRSHKSADSDAARDITQAE